MLTPCVTLRHPFHLLRVRDLEATATKLESQVTALKEENEQLETQLEEITADHSKHQAELDDALRSLGEL